MPEPHWAAGFLGRATEHSASAAAHGRALDTNPELIIDERWCWHAWFAGDTDNILILTWLRMAGAIKGLIRDQFSFTSSIDCASSSKHLLADTWVIQSDRCAGRLPCSAPVNQMPPFSCHLNASSRSEHARGAPAQLSERALPDPLSTPGGPSPLEKGAVGSSLPAASAAPRGGSPA